LLFKSDIASKKAATFSAIKLFWWCIAF